MMTTTILGLSLIKTMLHEKDKTKNVSLITLYKSTTIAFNCKILQRLAKVFLYLVEIFFASMKLQDIVKPKESLEVQQLDTPKPRGSQVLVKVQSSGVCHSDIHLWEG